MRPDEPNSRRVGTPLIPQRSYPLAPAPASRDHSQEAAAGLVRNQIDRIYSDGSVAPQSQENSATKRAPKTSEEAVNPYDRTHQEHNLQVQSDQWQQYHSAWQDYYQKYYERYYVGQVYQAQKALEERVQTTSDHPNTNSPQTPEALSRDEAMYDLRSKLLGKIKTSAKQARKSRHFIPITAAVCVMLVFLFLQYNRVLFANVQAYISPGNIDPANIIVDPMTSVAVGPEPKLIIPKINVDVPVVYDTKPDYDSQMKAMEGGVAYFGIPGANSRPGQVGNTVLSGHSSNDIIDGGSYKFIFARLDKMTKGDLIFVNYEGKRYTYSVTKTEVVKPTEVNKLIYPTDKPILTLITCTPLGTALNRLLVTAEQVSPNPAEASAAPAASSSTEASAMPGNSPTFLQRIFGGGQG